MIDLEKQKHQHQLLAKQADDCAREALHFMYENHPEEYAAVEAIASGNPTALRRLLRALYIAGYGNGQRAIEDAIRAAEDAKDHTIN